MPSNPNTNPVFTTGKDEFGNIGGPGDFLGGRAPGDIAFDLGDESNMPGLGHLGTTNAGARRNLRALQEEAFRIRNENDRRFGQASDFMMGQFDANTQQTITEDDINTMFAQQAEMGTSDFLRNNDAISESLGIRGVTGGVAADLAAQSHAQFQQALAQSKGNVRIAKIQSDFQDSMRNLNAAQTLGNFLATGADETGMVGAGVGIETNLAMGQQQLARGEARAGRKAAEFGGILSGITGLASGGLGLL